jgi:predicted nucleic acid-binding protein
VTYNRAVLLDNSVWQRYADGRLSGRPRRRFESAFVAGQVRLADPSALEILYSARTARDFQAIAAELDALPKAPAQPGVWSRARDLQRQLAESRPLSHRVKVIDLVLAAIAEHNDLAILHYDHDFDVIVDGTDLVSPSVWAAPRGSID